MVSHQKTLTYISLLDYKCTLPKYDINNITFVDLIMKQTFFVRKGGHTMQFCIYHYLFFILCIIFIEAPVMSGRCDESLTAFIMSL
jgi:hypothetical protein